VVGGSGRSPKCSSEVSGRVESRKTRCAESLQLLIWGMWPIMAFALEREKRKSVNTLRTSLRSSCVRLMSRAPQ